MESRHKYGLRFVFAVISSFAVGFGCIRLGYSLRSELLSVGGVVTIFASIGWPIGYVLHGMKGALFGVSIAILACCVLSITVSILFPPWQ